MTGEAAAGKRDLYHLYHLYHLDEVGFAPTLPTSYTWARVGTRPIVPYEAPQGRRVNVIGALAADGPRPRFVYASRRIGRPSKAKVTKTATDTTDGRLPFGQRYLFGLRLPRGGPAPHHLGRAPTGLRA